MKVIIDNKQINIFPQFSKFKIGRGLENELESLGLHRSFIVPVEIDGKINGQRAQILRSDRGEFSDEVLRLGYDGPNLQDSSRLIIEINKKGLEMLDIKEFRDYIRTSGTGTYQELVFWSPYSDKNPFKNTF
ncbi:hypothetical protein K9L16_02270 [Candidatus Pacearchaeota archaeon]|nr:hypothetical protein [Candidatus Pacearchaeota archaeon]